MKFKTRSYGPWSRFLLAAGLIAMLLVPSISNAQETQNPEGRTISVTGTGSANGAPDVAYITLGVEVENSNVGTAVEQVNQTMDDVIAALSEVGIPDEDIQTTNFNIRQNQAPPQPMDSQSAAESTYVVSNNAQVRVANIDQLSEVIQTALDAGANRMYGLNFGIQDTDSLLSEARQNAVNDAQARAEELASLFGVTLGDPIQISESTGGNQPVPQASAALGMGGGSPVIREGQMSISVSLNVTYEMAGSTP